MKTKYRIVKRENRYLVQLSFGHSWLSRFFGRQEEWYWISDHDSLEMAVHIRDVLDGKEDEEIEVVG